MNARLTPSGHAITGQQAYSGEPGLAAENTAFGAEMRALNADTEPLDTHGQAGDIVFWHHRLGRKNSRAF